MSEYVKVAQLKEPATLRARLAELGLELPVDDAVLTAAAGSPLAQTKTVAGRTIGNRWCIHPMEGWDAETDGSPSEYTLRRWRNFGLSGAKLIWGGEAAAVQRDGRANPRQTLAVPENLPGLRKLYDELVAAHREVCDRDDDLLVGLQLTHSGRFSRPNSSKLEPRIAYHHPLLDEKFHIDPLDASVVWTDSDLETLIDDYVRGAHLAAQAGFHFVDVKACHGYLLHEFLSARTRPGKFGGDLEGRSRVLRTIIGRIRDELPQLIVGVRLSLFDIPPYATSREVGKPMEYERLLPYAFGFGTNPERPLEYDLTEPFELLRMLLRRRRGADEHLVRQSLLQPTHPTSGDFSAERRLSAPRRSADRRGPPSAGRATVPTSVPRLADGRQRAQLPARLFTARGAMLVRDGWMDFVGLGRMVLSYPELPRETLEHGKTTRKKICRTFSDCTTAPRHHLISGCYPLDPYYKALPEFKQVQEFKQALKRD
ncbi:MAG: NADH:flavin oxidoreductase [Pirellulales bacterium]